MQRSRWFLPCALLVSSACATKASHVSQSTTDPSSAGPIPVRTEAELRDRALVLLAREAPPATGDEWQRLGEGTLAVLENIYADAAMPMELRLNAVNAMGFLSEPAASEALFRIVRDAGADVRSRSVAVVALVNRSGQAAVDDLIPLLNAPEESIRESTAKALGAAGGSVAQSSLEEQLERETEPGVRDAIQQSLTKIQP